MPTISQLPSSSFRPEVGGSGVTVFRWSFGKNFPAHVIAFARQVSWTEPPPVAQPVVVQPLDQPRPVEIVTPGAQSNGTITLTLTKLYNQMIWQRLAGLANSMDITDIMRTVTALADPGLTVSRFVQPLVPNHPAYTHTFYNVVVASIGDDPPIDITTVTLEKELTLWYTHYLFSPIATQQFSTIAVQSN